MKQPVRFRLPLVAVLTFAAAPALHAQGSAGWRIESWTARDSERELRFALPAEFGRRYRSDASTDQVSWETKLAKWVHFTVERLFDGIAGKLALRPEVIRVTFDPVSGPPASGFVDQSGRMGNEEMRFELSSLSQWRERKPSTRGCQPCQPMLKYQ